MCMLLYVSVRNSSLHEVLQCFQLLKGGGGGKVGPAAAGCVVEVITY